MGKSDSAVYYEENPIAYIKKKAYDTWFNRKAEQRAKRAELAKANRGTMPSTAKRQEKGKTCRIPSTDWCTRIVPPTEEAKPTCREIDGQEVNQSESLIHIG